MPYRDILDRPVGAVGKAQYLDVPMAHQDIADYLGVTSETLSVGVLPIWSGRTDIPRSVATTTVIAKPLWPSACNELSGGCRCTRSS